MPDDPPFAIPSAAVLPEPECRRLTGPGMLWQHPGAVLDVVFTAFHPDWVQALWRAHARQVLDAVGWGDQLLITRPFAGGVTLALSAPRDQLYAATTAAMGAWARCAADILCQPMPDLATIAATVRAEQVAEANPRLLALGHAAAAHGLDVLYDEDTVSVGHGTGSQCWPVGALPDQVNWAALHNIPVALITGTNGKTTTTRLCAAIGRAAGLVAGLTSTDLVRVGDRVLDHGDYSGPGGARLLLRDPDLEIGFLEVARGGILRRGLPIEHARAAAVLNVAADHLGEYGVNTVADLALAKFAVRRALGPGGVMVLNADDPLVAAQGALTTAPVWWFSLARQISDTAPCAWLDQGQLRVFDGTATHRVISVDDLPIALNGRAAYNIQNALAAILLTMALGVGLDAIRAGLAGFHNDVADNPGRCNEFAVKGARVFVDFAHNPHSIAAVTGALAGIAAKRRFVMISHAGDRSDADIAGLVSGAFALSPDVVVAAELPGYQRGRAVGEIPALIARTAATLGLAAQDILFAPSPRAGAEMILSMLQPGDLALLLVHSERDAVFAMLGQGAAG